MPVEFFTDSRRGFAPKASIRKHGQIGLNQGAIRRYAISNGQRVVLGYDREKKVVILKLTDDTEEPGAREIVVRGTGGSIAAKSFLDYFGIPYEKAQRFELFKDEQSGYLQFPLEGE